MKDLFKSPQFWLIVGILCLGMVLRGSLLSYGLPLLLHEDEPVYFSKAMAFGYGEFDPDYFKKPTFFLYFYFFFYYTYFLIGGFSSWTVFEHLFWQDPTELALIGRSVTLVFSIGSIYLVYLLGRRIFSVAVGIIAALLLALHTTHIQYSPIVISDIPSLFFILLTAWLAIGVYEHARWRDYLLCGASVALVMSFKYNVFSAAFLVSAHLLRYLPNGWWSLKSNLRGALRSKRLYCSLLLAGCLFVALSPYVLWNFDKFYEHLTFEKSHMLQRTLELDRSFKPFVSFPTLLFKIIPRDMSWPLYVIAMLGIVTSLVWPATPESFRKELNVSYAKILILLSFPATFLMAVSQFRLVNAKYVLPITPFLMVIAAFFAVWLVGRWISKPVYSSVIAGVLVLLLAFPLWTDSFAYVAQRQKTDTLAMAQRYLRNNLKPGRRLLLEKFTFPSWSRPVLRAILVRNSVLQMGEPETSADTVRKLNPDYILINPQPIKDPQDNKMLRFAPDYYAYLKQNYHIIRVISPYGQFDKKWLSSMTATRTQDYLKIYLYLEETEDKENPGPTLFLLQRR